MALRVNHNFQADFGHVNLLKTEQSMNRSLERLETGLRINSAKDDAAGLFIADQLKLVSKGLDQGSRNSQDGISAAQIAESTLSQIYDKLTSMYTKASQAATDTNDANARAALQRDIDSIVDAIDRMAKASEFNGIKLLDGSFTSKQIQYGARADQALDISIDAATAANLGANVVQGQGAATSSATSDYDTLVAGNWKVDSGDSVKINGTDLGLEIGKAVDASEVAKAINSNADLTSKGLEATASNKSVASTTFQTLTASGADTTLKFFVGNDTANPAVTITIKDGNSLTLNELVNSINGQGLDNLKASAENGKLVLTTSNGETLGVQVDIGANGTNSVDLSTLLQGATGSVTGGTSAVSGSAIKVGTVDIVGQDGFKIEYNGVSGTDEGLNFDVATGSDATLKNLNSLDVKSADSAELAMKVINAAIKKVDKNRSHLGSIQQNLQAIIDNNDFAAAQTREAESRIRNVDFAKEMAEFTRNQTLMQSGISMLAQANQLPQQVLQLLR